MKSTKDLGSGGSHGTEVWIAQRVTALALVPLLTVSITLTINAIINGRSIYNLFSSPLYTISTILTLLVSLHHSTLGIHEIIEDYIHINTIKYILLLTIKFIAIVSALSLFMAIIYAHVN